MANTTEVLQNLSPHYLSVDIGCRIVTTAIVFLVLQTVFVVLFYTGRYISKNTRGWEFSVIMPLAYIFCTTNAIAVLLEVEIGAAGRHTEAIVVTDPQKVIRNLKLTKAIEFTYIFSASFPKLAILCLYLRVFTQKQYRIATYVTGALVVVAGICAILVASFICRPLSYFWYKFMGAEGDCGDVTGFYRFTSLSNIVTDIMMMIIPLPAIVGLKVDLATKISLSITFLCGSFGLVTSIIRFTKFITNDIWIDPLYNGVDPLIWTIVEPGVYLITACLPQLRPIKRYIFKDISFTRMIMKHFDHGQSQLRSEPVVMTQPRAAPPTPFSFACAGDGGILHTTTFQVENKKTCPWADVGSGYAVSVASRRGSRDYERGLTADRPAFARNESYGWE